MQIKPYGDTMNDGAIQLSFTLPLPDSTKAWEAARLLVLKLGFEDCEIVHAASLTEGFTMFVAYGWTTIGIDMKEIVVDAGGDDPAMSFDEINRLISEKLGRKIIIVGASTGFDAHTVGIDAIMNMKGYNHHYGLERYPTIEAHNLGAQVSNQKLVDYSIKVHADAILVSQVVTQKDIHIKNLTDLVERLQAKKIREKFILLAGGPRISHKLALEIGFDAGFGKKSYAEDAATFIFKKMVSTQEAG